MPANQIQHNGVGPTYAHIVNFGASRKTIFRDESDYDTFITFLKEYLNPITERKSSKTVFTIRGRTFEGVPHLPKNYHNQIELVAYSLFPDHFHLVISQKISGAIEKFIRSISTRYAIYFNKKYQTTGSLFQGPYKSVQVSDSDELILLTHLLHNPIEIGTKASNHNSYSYYLASENNSWINTRPVLSHFENTQNEFFKGALGYKNFVEKYTPGSREKKILERISLEKETEHLVKSTEKLEKSGTSHKQTYHSHRLKIQHRVPELVGAAFVFLILFGLGINNIRASSSKVKLPSPNQPIVSGAHDEAPDTTHTPTPTETAESQSDTTQQNTIQEGVSAPINATESAVPGRTEAVEITSNNILQKITILPIGESKVVDLYQLPDLTSEVVGHASEGDVYDVMTHESGWYEVQIDSGTKAYLQSEYAQEVKE